MLSLIPYAQRPYRPCVGAVILNHHNLVFTGKRRDNASGSWQMPQGGVEKGEDPLNAVLREVLEETSLKTLEKQSVMPEWLSYDLPPDLADRLWGATYRGQTQLWYCFKFTGFESEINLETAHPEFCDWRWMPAQEVIEQAFSFKKDIYQKVLEQFQAEGWL